MKLWLVRHAQPLVAPGVCYGQLDLAADAAATADCARRLALALPAGIRVITSPLQRCAQLAQALLALRPDLACHADARLQEMDFGRWEGRAWQDIAPAELQAWTDDFADYPAGGTGESVAAFMARVGAAFDARADDARQQPPLQAIAPAFFSEVKAPPCATLWITHAGVIRAAQLLAQNIRHIGHARQWPLTAPNYGQWRTLKLDSGPAPAPSGACA